MNVKYNNNHRYSVAKPISWSVILIFFRLRNRQDLETAFYMSIIIMITSRQLIKSKEVPSSQLSIQLSGELIIQKFIRKICVIIFVAILLNFQLINNNYNFIDCCD